MPRWRWIASLPFLLIAGYFAFRFTAEPVEKKPLTAFAAGIVVGLVVSFMQRHLQRMYALLPLGSAGITVALVGRLLVPESVIPIVVLGVSVGVALLPIHRGLFFAFSQKYRFVCLYMVAIALLLTLLWLLPRDDWRLESIVLIAISAISLVMSTAIFLREIVEQLVEIIIWPLYRVRAFGRGLRQVPLHGPALVIANHAAWLDPIWLAKVLPCRLTPMMTARFFDVPIVGWVVRVLGGGIKVADTGFRREAPEIREVLTRLRRGEIVMIFPEGRLRRTKEMLLRRFGQGIYQILREMPHVPVIVCWIEGGWGSYTSFAGGPPTQGKKLDCRRLIRIGVSEPEIVPPELLEDGLRTRRYLMQACFKARKHIGLDVPEVDVFAKEHEKDEPD